jgi:hypothetical protein
MIPMRYSEARGTLIYEKNLKSKISCQTPFNQQKGPILPTTLSYVKQNMHQNGPKLKTQQTKLKFVQKA